MFLCLSEQDLVWTSHCNSWFKDGPSGRIVAGYRQFASNEFSQLDETRELIEVWAFVSTQLEACGIVSRPSRLLVLSPASTATDG